ncbi:PREDICTED: mitotic spindle assembly checkpoint protein MAD2B-like [Priapulus caudatus]|uniref:Mitotic spindle assembly checkpoint protein MAD2B-like n=1 Tax=Priapulus caudatus TaxID=37621 RepID=A0ABM1EVP4_PRICU|nr:PREDICTED: mitotic spindle assembly checkpoint protein MAD2B-like [Priapulus caudatus]
MTTMADGIDYLHVAADILCDFLEVAVHMIVYRHDVYPSAIFESRRKYGVPTKMSVHPELNSYLQSCLCDTRTLLLARDLDRIVVAILDTSGAPITKYTFEVWLPAEPSAGGDEYLVQVEQAFREFLLKVGACDTDMEALGNCSFALQLHSTAAGLLALKNGALPWVTCETAQRLIQGDARIVPLKSYYCELFKMQLYVEKR